MDADAGGIPRNARALEKGVARDGRHADGRHSGQLVKLTQDIALERSI
jgi:hypothetical protein